MSNEPTISITRPTSQSETPKTSKPGLKTHTVELPSKGFFYNQSNPLSSGKVEIYEVTVKHEDILSNQNLLKKGTVLDEFLKSLIATEGVSLDDITIGDKNALFVASRILAYGEDYSIKVKCPECGFENTVSVDLSKIKPIEYDFSKIVKGENKFNFVLPVSGKRVTWKLLTHKDETSIDSEIKALNRSLDSSSPEITTRLKYLITSIDGDFDRLKIKRFVDNELTSRDSLALRRSVKEFTPDLDMTFDFACGKCGHTEKSNIPMNTNFFWPSVSE